MYRFDKLTSNAIARIVAILGDVLIFEFIVRKYESINKKYYKAVLGD
jgi:hypothetical protein